MKKLDKYIQRLRFKQASKYITNNSKLLDIGCNQGEFFEYLKAKNISGLGIDPLIDESQISLPPNVDVVKTIFPTNHLTNQQFDFISALAILEHIPREEQYDFSLACFHLLSDHGKIIITTPSPLVDKILHLLQFFKLIDGMSLEQHFGFNPIDILHVFSKPRFKLILHKRFEFGLNHLFVFEKINE